jgi:uncharacterized protein (TIGR03067 family)
MRTALFVALLAAGGLVAEDRKDAPNDGKKAFQGTWTIVAMERGGKKVEEKVTASTVVFDGDKYRILAGDKAVEEGTFRVDASKSPNQIDVAATAGIDKGTKWHGVYELEGDTLRAVVGPADKDRPKKLADPAPGTRGFTLKREKKGKE